MSRQTVNGERPLRGVAILTPATLLAKFIGLFYKIPLIAVVGVAGMAYFLSAYHVYSMLFVLFASGLPTALSLLVSRAAVTTGNAVGRIFAVTFFCFLGLATLGGALLFFFAAPVARLLAMPDAAGALRLIAPALPFAVVTGAVKGLFQGHHDMLPSAAAEVLEALGKLLFGVTLARLARAAGGDTASVAAAAVAGVTAGAALSALVMLVWLLAARRRLFAADNKADNVPTPRAVLGALWRVAFPITVSAAVTALITLIDTALISAGLQGAGFAPTVAHEMYSSYGNLALPLYNLVPALLAPVTLSLLPALGKALAGGDFAGAASAYLLALRVSLLITLPAAFGLAVFAAPILSVLYVGEQGAVALAAPLLSLLAVSLPLTVFISVTTSALQAIGKPALPVYTMLSGACLKLVLEWGLLSLPAVNIYAAPVSTFACNFLVLAANLWLLARKSSFSTPIYRMAIGPLFAAAAAIFFGVLVYRVAALALSPLPALAVTLLLVVLLYFLAASLFGLLDDAVLGALPFGTILLKCKK
ncbi:MAG: oligosaccharide flippase family protein [Clostridia bacterium]|nr:oligosaccharide flippase family protein [Clostridia bacterium]